MKVFGVRALALAGAAMVLAGAQPVLAQARGGPSDYLQCDGQPNNVTAGESLARFVGAVTLLGIFAPAQETADAGQRRKGADGVAACSRLLDATGAAAETNVNRRIPLLIARAIHQIEAANYDAAIADITLARNEATTAGLTADPYFMRSTGRSFASVEAHAQLRLGNIDEARRIGLTGVEAHRHSLHALISYDSFSQFSPTRSADEDVYSGGFTRLLGGSIFAQAARYEETGAFTEAAVLREDMMGLGEVLGVDTKSSSIIAGAALSQALAGNWERSNRLAEEARTNMESRTRSGNGENNNSYTVELLDLQAVLRAAHEGRISEARRTFAARSAWPSASFGAVLETVRRLREGAPEAELTGPLAVTPEQMWDRRRENELAEMIEKDGDNRTLWRNLRAHAPASAYEALSNNVWRVERSRLIGRPDNSGWERITMPTGGGFYAGIDGMVLHAALVARHRGKKGFVMLFTPQNPTSALVRMGEPPERGISAERFIDAAAVIAELEPVIPSPETVRARRQGARRR